jgi:hypothetical protein
LDQIADVGCRVAMLSRYLDDQPQIGLHQALGQTRVAALDILACAPMLLGGVYGGASAQVEPTSQIDGHFFTF